MNIAFRVDASAIIGTGHLMRCLTLADALSQRGAQIQFISRYLPEYLQDMLLDKGYEFRMFKSPANEQIDNLAHSHWLGTTQQSDADEALQILSDRTWEWLVVDHYALDARWESALRQIVRRILVIDDIADRQHDCDILLDQNFYANMNTRYADLVSPFCTTLLGPEYALLRTKFSELRKHVKSRSGEVHRVLVFFGGSDPENSTSRVLEALSSPAFIHLDIDVVLGAANPHRTHIERQIESFPSAKLHIQIDNMAELMCQADLSIGAGGSTTWERFCLGLPSLVVTIADNQVQFTRDLHNDGLLRWLGTSQEVDVAMINEAIKVALQQPQTNRQESERGMRIVDGHGAARVVQMLLHGPDPDTLHVRRAVDADCTLFWHWANDPEVRANAFNSDLILWENHRAWFTSKLQDPDTTIYVIECDKGPIGQVRFERKNEHYCIDYSLARQYRGLGLGKKLMEVSIRTFFIQQQTSGIIAEVKADNISSYKVFEGLGFNDIPPPPP